MTTVEPSAEHLQQAKDVGEDAEPQQRYADRQRVRRHSAAAEDEGSEPFRFRELNRRKFLGLTGGLAVAGAVVACGQGGTYDPPLGPAKQAAASPTMEGMAGAASPTPKAA
jgi:hypothetical protein